MKYLKKYEKFDNNYKYWKVSTKEPNLRIALRKIGLKDGDEYFNKIILDYKESLLTKNIYVIKHKNEYWGDTIKWGKYMGNLSKISQKDIEEDKLIQASNKYNL